MPNKGLATGEDGITRCWWAGDDPLYRSYHDNEWGRPMKGDEALFELLMLEAFQSGLSWLTILRKREGFRKAFDGFSIEKIARYSKKDFTQLMKRRIDRQESSQDPRHDQQRPALRRPRRRVRKPCTFVWTYEPDAKTPQEADTRQTDDDAQNTRVHRHEQRPEETRLVLRRLHNRLLIHAISRHSHDHIEGCTFREPCEQARASFSVARVTPRGVHLVGGVPRLVTPNPSNAAPSRVTPPPHDSVRSGN